MGAIRATSVLRSGTLGFGSRGHFRQVFSHVSHGLFSCKTLRFLAFEGANRPVSLRLVALTVFTRHVKAPATEKNTLGAKKKHFMCQFNALSRHVCAKLSD
ncbi:hypothetical protein [Gemmata obscuriglobus]|uniref:hypothetical protein n=1 Tax=Gemmata obscuriglobus TaxID=114 RepID=UPI0011CD6278|nr:hypothetical protein [Gemmata obscuriglobus]